MIAITMPSDGSVAPNSTTAAVGMMTGFHVQPMPQLPAHCA